MLDRIRRCGLATMGLLALSLAARAAEPAETATTPPREETEVPAGVAGQDRFNLIPAETLLGRGVVDAAGKLIGEIRNLLVEIESGDLAVVLDTGGPGLKLLPWRVLRAPREGAEDQPPLGLPEADKHLAAAREITPRELPRAGEAPRMLTGDMLVVPAAPGKVLVRGREGEPIGWIDEVVVDAGRGRIAFVELSPAAPEIEMATGPVRVPYEALEWSSAGPGFALDITDSALVELASSALQGVQMGAEDMLDLYQDFGLQPYWQ